MKLIRARRFPPASQAFLVLALLLPAVPAAAQSEVFTGDVEVRGVNVDVVVTNADGAPVTGLTREDFELLVDGAPVAIRYFAVAEAPPEPPPTEPPTGTESSPLDPTEGAESSPLDPPEGTEPEPADAEERLNLVVLLDRAYLRPGDAADLQPALQELVDRDLRPGDRVMLARADRLVQVVSKLRRPPVDLAPLFAEETRLGRGERLRTEYQSIMRLIDEQLSPELQRRPDKSSRLVAMSIESYAREAEADVERTLVQLRFLVSALAGLPGRKAVLYIGGRMPITPGASLVDAWRSAYSAATDTTLAKEMQALSPQAEGFEDPDGPLETRNFYTVPALQVPERAPELFAALAREAGARGVTFYTLDASLRRSTAWRSMRGSQSALALRAPERWDFHASQRQGNKAVMTALAETTGGRAVIGQREVGELLDALRASRTASYSLGFSAAAERSEEMHTVEVRLRPASGRKLKKLRLRHRRHFYDRLPDTEVADRTISAVLLAESAFANPLELELDVGEPPAATGDEPRSLPITVKVPVARLGLVAERRAHRGQLSLFWSSGSFSGGVAPVMKTVVPVRIRNAELLAAFGRDVEYQLAVTLPPHARAIAVSVRDDLASDLGTITHLLE